MEQITQQQFLDDVKTKIYQYLYRSFDYSFDDVLGKIQQISLLNNLNWQQDSNKQRLKNVFIALSSKLDQYNASSGDFRTFMLLSFIDCLYNEFSTELFSLYLKEGYNVTPESVVGSLDNAYSTAPPQNTDFPGTTTTSRDIQPIHNNTRLIPDALYETNRNFD